MENTKSFTDLIMWEKAHLFVLETYTVTEDFPKSELFGIVSQIRRAAVSIPANEAEGYKRRGKAEKLRFFNISQGSVEECRYYIILSKDLKYIDENQYNSLMTKLEDASRTLNNYCKILLNDINQAK